MDAADPDLPDAAVEHISQMLTLAKSKHQEAIAMLGTPVPVISSAGFGVGELAFAILFGPRI